MSVFSAIVLAGGSGKRMGGAVKKQYMELLGKPLIFYALDAFEKSSVDEIVLVTTPTDVEYCKKEIVERFGFQKVKAVVPGGAQRYDSVYEGLKAASGDYVLIHDGARAFVTPEIIRRSMEAVVQYDACVVGMPSKDTVKIASAEGFVASTPSRESVWVIQTPQTFAMELVRSSYEKVLGEHIPGITDDAMVVELATDRKVKLIEGSYENIKVTTPEDLTIGEEILKNRHMQTF